MGGEKVMEKKQYWLVESNGDLSITCTDLETVKDLIEADFEDFDLEDQDGLEYTITPVWYTDEEYENLPEA